MRVQIAARHCDIPDSLRARAEEQVLRLAKYDPRVSTAEVVFEEEKVVRRVEVLLGVHGGAPVVARGEDPDFLTALDKVIARLGRRLKRQRDRKTNHKAPPLSDGVAGD